MNWQQYVAATNDQLGVDADRRGIEKFKSRMIRNSVVDLQRFIPGYRKGHTKIYGSADLIVQEHAQLGAIPSGATPQAFYIFSSKADSAGVRHPLCQRNRLRYVPWALRQSMICDPSLFTYTYAISPDGRSFYTHPLLNEETELQLVWTGLKQDFSNFDEVPFPEEAAEASAAYAKWRILLEVDKRPDLAGVQFGIWGQKRLSLYRDFQETLDAEKQDFVDGRMLADKIRSDLHSWMDLAAVPTAAFTPPIVVGWVNQPNGVITFAELIAGTDESDPDNGLMRPDDYSAQTNAKIWHQIS